MVDYPTPAEPGPKHVQHKDAKKKRIQLRDQEPQRVLPQLLGLRAVDRSHLAYIEF